MSAAAPLRVVLTRTREGNEPLTERLQEAGFAVVECPLIRIEPLEGPPLAIERYDWLLLTSRVAVELLFRRLQGGLPQRVAVIGPGTAEALRRQGVEPTLVAERPTQEGLAAAPPRPAGLVLFAGAEGARDVLIRELDADFVPLYRTVPQRPPQPLEGDFVLLASPSAARSLAALRRDLPCVSIGPVTSEEIRALGLPLAAEAISPGLDGIVAAVKLAASQLASSRS